MTEEEIKTIEKHLGFRLPELYRSTVLAYPFPENSFAAEFVLPNRAQEVIELSDAAFSSPDIGKPFFIGTDGGDEWYFVDALKEDSGVFVFELETGKHHPLTTNWSAYLDHIAKTHADIAADEESERQRKLKKKWWQFWI